MQTQWLPLLKRARLMVLACAAIVAPTCASTIAVADVLNGTTTTLSNMSASSPAHVTVGFGTVVTFDGSTSPLGTSSLLYTSTFDRTGQTAPLFAFSQSLNAPPDMTKTFSVAPSFAFDIPSGASVVLTAAGEIRASSFGPPVLGSTHGILEGTTTTTLANESSVPVMITTAANGFKYMLSVSGTSPSSIARAGVSFPAPSNFFLPPFSDELTADGSRTVPFQFDQSSTLAPGQVVHLGGSILVQADVTNIPEPCTMCGIGIALFGLTIYAKYAQGREAAPK